VYLISGDINQGTSLVAIYNLHRKEGPFY